MNAGTASHSDVQIVSAGRSAALSALVSGAGRLRRMELAIEKRARPTQIVQSSTPVELGLATIAVAVVRCRTSILELEARIDSKLTYFTQLLMSPLFNLQFKQASLSYMYIRAAAMRHYLQSFSCI